VHKKIITRRRAFLSENESKKSEKIFRIKQLETLFGVNTENPYILSHFFELVTEIGDIFSRIFDI